MSGGGEVGHFCATKSPHNRGCEYFSDGGVVAPDFIPDEPEKSNNDAMDTVKAFGDGAIQGALGPFGPGLQIASGLTTKEDINRRTQGHPIAHGVGEAGALAAGMFTGMGEAGLISKAAAPVAEALTASATGAKILKAAIESASFAGSDEMTKALLGQPGADPEHPLGAAILNVGAAGLLGGAAGSVFSLGEGMIGKGIDSIKSEKGIAAVENMLDKMGSSSEPLKKIGVGQTSAKILSHISAATTTAKKVYEGDLFNAAIEYPIIQQAVQKQLGSAFGAANKFATDAVIKGILTNEISGIPNACHYAIQGAKGLQKISDGMGMLWKAGASQVAPEFSEEANDKLKKIIEDGGTNKQMETTMQQQGLQSFAVGGEVKGVPNEGFSKIFPEQNMLLSAAKSRIYNYLNSIRPLPNQPKLAFDEAPKNKEQNSQYDMAIDLAVRPSSVLDHINAGTLTTDHMNHFRALFPETHNMLSKEMTKKITESQLKNEKPPYAKRQSMSMFLGTPLDSTLSQPAIATIQGLYAIKQSQQQQQGSPAKSKKGTSTLSKSPTSSLTDSQAREQRMQNQKA